MVSRGIRVYRMFQAGSHDDPYAGGRSNTTRTARLASQRKGARNLRKATSPCLEKLVRAIRVIPGMAGMFFHHRWR